MSMTTLANVTSNVSSELLAQMALKPLRSKFVALPLSNASNIDGAHATNRKIPLRVQIAEALDDAEGVEFTEYEPFTYGTPITLTPTGKIMGIEPTVKSMRRVMPGATRDAVIEAVKSGDPQALPILAQFAEEVIISHYRRAERAALAVFAGITGSTKGTTNTALSMLTLVDSQTAVLAGNPEHRVLACVVSEKGIGDLRRELITGSGVGLAALWSNGYGESFLEAIGDSYPSAAPEGNILDMPVFGADVSLMSTANAGVDSVGATFAIGRGETAAPGSLRGLSELCEGHGLSMGIEFELAGDIAKVVGRYEWDLQKHTDAHGCQLIFKKT